MTDTVYPNLTTLDSHPVKIFIKGEIRRFSFVGTSFDMLCAAIRPLLDVKEFSVRYEDEEGDLVTIRSDAELSYALSLAGTRPLRLRVEEKTVVSDAPVSPVFGTPTRTLSSEKSWKELKLEAKMAKKQFKEELKSAKWEGKEAKMAKKQFHEELKAAKWEEKAAIFEAKMAKREHHGSPKSSFVARFVKHVTVDDGAEFCPSTSFVKTWRFRNEGTIPWPENSVLLCVGKKADQIGATTRSVILPRSVMPGEEVDVSVNMIAPAAGGSYTGFWKLADPSGRKFGPRVRVQIKVIDSSSSSSDEAPSSWGEMLAQLESMGFTNKALNVKLLVKTHGNIDKVIRKLLKKEEKKSGVVAKQIAAM